MLELICFFPTKLLVYIVKKIFGKKIFIVSEQKNRQKYYKQMLYTTYIIIYKIQKYKIKNTHHKT